MIYLHIDYPFAFSDKKFRWREYTNIFTFKCCQQHTIASHFHSSHAPTFDTLSFICPTDSGENNGLNCHTYAKTIWYLQSITGVEIGSWIKHERLFSALCRSISNDHSNLNDEEMYASKAFCVALPDQHHSYFVTENDDVSMKCASISSIPFRWISEATICF